MNKLCVKFGQPNFVSFPFFIQVLYILTENLQSPGTTSFSVTPNQPTKICPVVN